MVKVVPDGREFIVWDDQAGKELGRYNTQSQASYNANLLQYQQNNQRDDQNQAQRAQKWGEANNPAPARQGPQQPQYQFDAQGWQQGPNQIGKSQNSGSQEEWNMFKKQYYGEGGIGAGTDDPYAGWDPTKDIFKTGYGGDQQKQKVWQDYGSWLQQHRQQVGNAPISAKQLTPDQTKMWEQFRNQKLAQKYGDKYTKAGGGPSALTAAGMAGLGAAPGLIAGVGSLIGSAASGIDKSNMENAANDPSSPEWQEFQQWWNKANNGSTSAASLTIQGGPKIQQGYSTGVFNYKDWLEKRRNGWI